MGLKDSIHEMRERERDHVLPHVQHFLREKNKHKSMISLGSTSKLFSQTNIIVSQIETHWSERTLSCSLILSGLSAQSPLRSPSTD